MTIISKTHGTFKVMFDKDDLNKVNQYKWSINKFGGKSPKYYAVRRGSILLHRFIMDAPKGILVDHIDGNTIDNRKSNLRLCNIAENTRNQKISINNKSGKTGVFWYKITNKWVAKIMINHKYKTLGYFKEFDEAVMAREQAEEKYYGEFKHNR